MPRTAAQVANRQARRAARKAAKAGINPVEAAVAPLRADAVTNAEQYARKRIAAAAAALAAAGNDLQICAPYPNSRKLSTYDYQAAMTTYRFFHMICKSRQGSRRISEADFADVDAAMVERFVELSKSNAAAQYDAFVNKLVTKIGSVKSAVLQGNHVWSYSVLTVVTASGETQNWKTQTIVNVSKLGTLFNQWPTRLLKGGR